MNVIHLLGLDGTHLTPEKAEVLRSCSAVFSTKRFSDLIEPVLISHPDLRILPISPISESLSRMEEMLAISDVAVLASGDPLFFGIGRTLCQRFGEAMLRIHPAVSSMQMAFARFKIPWDDAKFFSVHGREMDCLCTQIGSFPKVFLLTDTVNSPAAIAAALLKNIGEVNAGRYTVHVAENLGEVSEHLTTGSLQKISKGTFSSLNVMIITRNIDANECDLPRFGLMEDEIVHVRGLITKNEVRAATLHSLRLPETGVFWDIGAGSGAIGLEAARMYPMLQVFAVERNAGNVFHITTNRQTYNAYNLTVVPGDAPAILGDLPDPERIFVGGGGKRLQDILHESVERLKPGGIIVVNAVIDTTRIAAPEIFHKMGLSVSLSRISVSRSSYPENNSLTLNPITVITGCKPLSTLKEGGI
jgi:precorrin-6B C5,15-methyltransferase / cobalt-precorrin-6B C5,C15-methyltransferase